ncbi:metal ABC transporter ATP-binding protein [Candidatus Uhrbacteria bacterium]|nr:metal ABC transporter ATP-binding protein [Candidatus Uhrbacteria bacterium]
MPEQSPKTNNIPAVSVRDLTVVYGSNRILDQVSFEVSQGSVAAIIGPNGSGKTTAVRAILGLIPKNSGRVHLLGKHVHSVRTLIGYVPQRFEFDHDFPMTVGEYMDMARRLRCSRHFRPEIIPKKIKEVGLREDILSANLGELSGGQLQRVLIAQAIINDPAILFLDEPTTGIDISGEASLYGIIEHLNRVHNTTVIMVTHDISVISNVVDTVICLNRKMLCYGPPKTALTERKLNELFGKRSGIYEHRH